MKTFSKGITWLLLVWLLTLFLWITVLIRSEAPQFKKNTWYYYDGKEWRTWAPDGTFLPSK